MSVCRRCGHSNDELMMICTHCGIGLRPDRPAPKRRSLYPRLGLWLLFGALLTVFVFLVLIYLDTVNRVIP